MENGYNKQEAETRVRCTDWLDDGFATPPRLKDIEHYQKRHSELCRKNPYAKLWKLRIGKHTNRHPRTNGGSWGWYAVFPFESEVVGYWNDSGEDDMRGVDLAKWAESANAGLSHGDGSATPPHQKL